MRSKSWLRALAAAMTRTPCATRSWTKAWPQPPAAAVTSAVVPGASFAVRWKGPVGDIVENTGDPPAWLYYVRVSNLEAARARAEARGAKVLSEAPVPAGRALYLNDPQGAAFGLRS